MRTTFHGGSRHKNGKAYSPKHNDRQFDISHSDNIHKSDEPNMYLHRYSSDEQLKHLTFEEAEMKFYKDTFQAKLDEQNAKALRSRHTERIQTMEQYKEKHPPYEMIMQIGNAREHVDRKTLEQAVLKMNNYIVQTYPQFRVLDIAGHFDETTDHFQIRGTWVAHDDKGNLYPNQNRALEEMGVNPPDMTKEIGRYNNRLQTFTADCRAKFHEICIELGLEIETKPLEASRMRRDTLQYQCDTLQTQVDELEQKTVEVEKNYNDVIEEINYRAKHDMVINNALEHQMVKAQLTLAEEKIAQYEEVLKAHGLEHEAGINIEKTIEHSHHIRF